MPGLDDNNSLQNDLDPGALDHRDEDNLDREDQGDQGAAATLVDDGAPADRPFDTNMELVLLLDRLKVSRALQQDVLDFIFHPDFDVSEVLPRPGTAASRHRMTFTMKLELLLSLKEFRQPCACWPAGTLQDS